MALQGTGVGGGTTRAGTCRARTPPSLALPVKPAVNRITTTAPSRGSSSRSTARTNSCARIYPPIRRAVLSSCVPVRRRVPSLCSHSLVRTSTNGTPLPVRRLRAVTSRALLRRATRSPRRHRRRRNRPPATITRARARRRRCPRRCVRSTRGLHSTCSTRGAAPPATSACRRASVAARRSRKRSKSRTSTRQTRSRSYTKLHRKARALRRSVASYPSCPLIGQRRQTRYVKPHYLRCR